MAKNYKTLDTKYLTAILNTIIVGNSKAKSRFIKYYYFLWRNGIDTTQTKFSEMTEEEFLKRYNIDERKKNSLKAWEGTREYKRIKLLLFESQMIDDILKIYDVTRKKALEGDDKAVKTLLMLQDVIKNLNQEINFSTTTNDKPQEEETEQENDDSDDDIELTLD